MRDQTKADASNAPLPPQRRRSTGLAMTHARRASAEDRTSAALIAQDDWVGAGEGVPAGDVRLRDRMVSATPRRRPKKRTRF